MSVFDQQRVGVLSAARYRNYLAKYLALTDNFSDATISANSNTSSRIQIYRDLTINAGIVLTANYSPQVIICRKLIFGSTSSQISANGKGASGGVGALNNPGTAGNGGVANTTISATAHIAPGSSTTVPSDLLDTVFPDGGAGNPSTAGSNGSAFPDAGLLLVVGGFQLGAIVGGGGGGAGAGRNGGSANGGGTKGYSGSGSGLAGSGGGSGVGAGGGGGGNNIVSGNLGTGGNGGAGGGALYIYCDDIQGSAGLLTANGSNGSAGTPGGSGVGGGGGGGGGMVVLYTRLLTVTPTMQANGGTGGAGAGTGGLAGGNGGAGLSAIMRN